MAWAMSRPRAKISIGKPVRLPASGTWLLAPLDASLTYLCSSAKRVRQLNILKDGKAQRNADGEITKAASFQSREVPNARIEPNRKWFNNTRVISQESLTAFRSAMAEKAADPYSVLLKSNKLPMSLIKEGETNGLKKHQAKMTIETSSFGSTFGPKAQRKRVKISSGTITDLMDDADKSLDTYNERLEQAKLLSGNSGPSADGEDEGHVTMSIEPIFNKGQSKRIWNELYRVLDSSDVVIHVLDARDPLGTRCKSVEKYLSEEAPHKHLIFVLNKTDLVPTSVAVSFCLLLFLPFLQTPVVLSGILSHSVALNGRFSVTRWEYQGSSRCPGPWTRADGVRFGFPIMRRNCITLS